MVCGTAFADFRAPINISTNGNFNGATLAGGQVRDAAVTIFRYDFNGGLRPGLFAESGMDFSRGEPGASFAIYGMARGVGKIGSHGVHDIVGVHGTVYKDFNGWAAGMHTDCYDFVAGGTCIGLNIEFPKTQDATRTIGINIQPGESARGIIGIQLQNAQAYKYGADFANTNIVLGRVDDCAFGMRFNPQSQRLEFFRNIGESNEIRMGFVDMMFGQPDSQLNKGPQ